MTKSPEIVKLAKSNVELTLSTITKMPDFTEAVCVGGSNDPETWHPEPEDYELAAHAKALCGTCPLIEQCLILALSDPETTGIWGGSDEIQRSAMQASPCHVLTPEEWEEGVAILTQSVARLAIEYGVNVRTVTRWKQSLSEHRVFASHLQLAA